MSILYTRKELEYYSVTVVTKKTKQVKIECVMGDRWGGGIHLLLRSYEWVMDYLPTTRAWWGYLRKPI